MTQKIAAMVIIINNKIMKIFLSKHPCTDINRIWRFCTFLPFVNLSNFPFVIKAETPLVAKLEGWKGNIWEDQLLSQAKVWPFLTWVSLVPSSAPSLSDKCLNLSWTRSQILNWYVSQLWTSSHSELYFYSALVSVQFYRDQNYFHGSLLKYSGLVTASD